MKEAYKKQLLTRLNAVWSSADCLVTDVVEHDNVTWLVTYRHQETGETVTGPVRKHDLRQWEKHQVFSLLSQAVFHTPAPAPAFSSALSLKEQQDIRRLVRSSVAGQAESPVKLLASFVDTLVLNVYPTDTTFAPVKRTLDEELANELAAWKEQAQEEEEPVPTRFTFCDLPLLMTAKGGEGFQWILRNSKLSLAVNRGSKMALLAQVRCSSEYLWSVRDLGRVISEVHAFLMTMFGDYVLLQPSACDLAVDVTGLDLSSLSDIKRSFVTRAQLKGQNPLSDAAVLDGPSSIKQRWDRITGLPFGSRAGAISGIIYDKLHEITYHSPEKGWFRDLWLCAKDEQGCPLWDGSSPVHRIEMRFKRLALNELKQEGVFHGIDDAYELEDRLPDLWSYAVGHVGGIDGLPDGWLRYVLPTDDTNRSRWLVHPDWEVIQSAFRPVVLEPSAAELAEQEQEELLALVDEELSARPWEHSAPKTRRARSHTMSPAAPSALATPAPDVLHLIPLVRRRKYTVNLDRLVKQITGCVITAEAWRPGRHVRADGVQPDISETVHFLYPYIEQCLEEKNKSYHELVQKKQSRYSIEKTDDNAQVA